VCPNDPRLPTDGYAPRETSTARFTRDDDNGPTAAVVDAVTAASAQAPTQIDPLYEVIDPDALAVLFEDPAARNETDARPASADRYLSFRYADCTVTIYGDGMVVATRVPQ